MFDSICVILPWLYISQSNSCFVGVNLLEQCFSEVSEISIRNLSEMEKKCPKINRPKFFASDLLTGTSS